LKHARVNCGLEWFHAVYVCVRGAGRDVCAPLKGSSSHRGEGRAKSQARSVTCRPRRRRCPKRRHRHRALRGGAHGRARRAHALARVGSPHLGAPPSPRRSMRGRSFRRQIEGKRQEARVEEQERAIEIKK
jgi:hypothetical protein